MSSSKNHFSSRNIVVKLLNDTLDHIIKIIFMLRLKVQPLTLFSFRKVTLSYTFNRKWYLFHILAVETLHPFRKVCSRYFNSTLFYTSTHEIPSPFYIPQGSKRYSFQYFHNTVYHPPPQKKKINK